MENINDSIEAKTNLESASVSIVGVTFRIITDSEQTSGAYSLVGMLITPN